ncbi:MAG: 3-hydroxyacyl-CoA dehydrogenase family protein [Ginsengibacter sp.]
MNIFVYGNEEQQKEIESINTANNFVFTFKTKLPENDDYKNHDAFLLLSDFSDEIDFTLFENKPVVVNSVTETLADLNYPLNVSRINAWPGFLEREIWEIASYEAERIEIIFKGFNRKIFFVKDEPGFVAARVISMIINEAFFAFGENVSTKEEIDLAMKLGTNYSQGPFEWAQTIGIEKIYFLLKKLSEKDERYLAAPALKKLFLEETATDFIK